MSALARAILTALALVVLCSPAMQCWASEATSAGTVEDMMGGEHKVHTANLLGLKVISLTAFFEDGAKTLWGAGVFYEREVIQEWLEIEINVPVVANGDFVIVPLDLIFKIPWHVSPYVTPYVGAGPALDLVIDDDRTEAFGGISSVVGVYVWFDMLVGLDVEFDYNIVFEDGHIVHELAPSLGPVIHF